MLAFFRISELRECRAIAVRIRIGFRAKFTMAKLAWDYEGMFQPLYCRDELIYLNRLKSPYVGFLAERILVLQPPSYRLLASVQGTGRS